MANWPREIKPEDRVKYLIQARADLNIEWGADGLAGVTDRDERLWVAGQYEAWYATDHSPEFLVGEYDDVRTAKKALHDHVVVVWAVAQAWEDVAT